MTDRLKSLKSRLNLSKSESFLVSNPVNIFYLTGLGNMSDEKDFWLLLTSKNNYLLTDPRYSSAIKPSPDFRLLEINKNHPLILNIMEIMRQNIIQTLGFEEKGLSFFEYQKFMEALKPIAMKSYANQVEGLRQIKNINEISKISAAAKITDLAFKHILEFIKPGLSEREIALELEIYMRQHGADGIAFAPVVAFGQNSAVPHHQTGADPLGSNGILLLDFGCRFEGYCSDLTRTVFVGKPHAKWRKIYNLVLKSQNEALTKIKPGMMACNADELIRQVLRSEGFEEQFLHSSGHGVGLEIHEYFTLSPNNKTVLAPGMVFTIEPGIYLKNEGGIRIENTVVLEKNGTRSLTQSPSDLIIL